MGRARVAAGWACVVFGMAALAALPASGEQPASNPGASAEAAAFFERSVRPVLVERCQTCHGAEKQKGGLRLDSRAAVLKGGATGPAIVPGKPEESLLIDAINYGDLYQMPPKGKLPPEQVAALTRWVSLGAPWPGGPSAAEAASSRPFDLKERARFWSFQPVRDPAPPDVSSAGWPRTPIDRFLLARLEQEGLAPAPDADRRTLIRRLTFDLIGLPPTPAEVEAFVADTSADAYETLVERLLASPHYGERWARHWLDLVRFAETAGHEFDYDILGAYRYRDYVIRALNADVPYDQFVIEHLAGDLLDPPRRHPTERFNESVIATGFFFLGEGTHSPVDLLEDEAARVDNQIDVLSKAFLGLTVACARCHDHKFDPISTRDYYALAGYLQSSRLQHAFIDPPERIGTHVRELERMRAEIRSSMRQHQAARVDSERPLKIAEYLLAAQRVARGGNTEESRHEAAEAAGLDEAVLKRWCEALAEPAAARPGHPLRAWTAMVQAGTDGKDLRDRLTDSPSSAPGTALFEDFSKPGYDGWFAAGDAFGAGPSQAGQVRVGGPREQPRAALVAGGQAHSGLVSDRLQGVLRSRTFTIEQKFIHYLAAGRAGRINLVIDGYEKIRDPIYGGLTLTVNAPDWPRWYAQDVSMWLGHRAYIELADGATAVYTGGHTEYSGGDGFLAVDEIWFSDTAAAPSRPDPFAALLLDDTAAAATPEALAARYDRIIARALRDWAGGSLQGTERDSARAAALGWLMERGLIAVGSRESEPKALAAYREVEARIPEPTLALAITEGTGEDERVHIRGGTRTLGEVVPRRFLEAIAGAEPCAPAVGSGRLELARRLVDRSNPLLARVMVNRIWLHHFGQGLVPTPDDFGKMGQPPSHPELLDWLASRFIENGYSIKAMHRLIVNSRAYRMQSTAGPEADQTDPTNRLLHRMNIRRLEAEAIRDAMLAVSSRLDRTLYGRGVPPHLTPFMEGRGRPAASGPLDGHGRRSIYINLRRNFLPPLLLAFDFPVPASALGRRNVSNVPAQALALLNDPFVLEQARRWADRVLAEPDRSTSERISLLYETAFARQPSATERDQAEQFLRSQASAYGQPDDPRAWADLCHVLLNVKEFLFIN